MYRMKDLLLCVYIAVKTLNLQNLTLFGRLCSKCQLHVQHDYFSSFNQSSHCFLPLLRCTVNFPHLTNQIVVLWRCHCRCSTRCFNSLIWQSNTLSTLYGFSGSLACFSLGCGKRPETTAFNSLWWLFTITLLLQHLYYKSTNIVFTITLLFQDLYYKSRNKIPIHTIRIFVGVTFTS